MAKSLNEEAEIRKKTEEWLMQLVKFIENDGAMAVYAMANFSNHAEEIKRKRTTFKIPWKKILNDLDEVSRSHNWDNLNYVRRAEKNEYWSANRLIESVKEHDKRKAEE